jgi:hypothetical protein
MDPSSPSSDLVDMMIGVVFGLAGVIVGILGVWAARKYGSHEGTMVVAWELVPPSNISAASARDHIVDVSLCNVGPVDIGSGNFDGGRALAVRMLTSGGRPVAVKHVDGDSQLDVTISHDGWLQIAPQLIKRGSWPTIRVQTEEPVTSLETGQLFQVEVSIMLRRDLDDREARRLRRLESLSSVGWGAGIVTLTVASGMLPGNQIPAIISGFTLVAIVLGCWYLVRLSRRVAKIPTRRR